jgi:hypothetical protein
MIVARRRWGSGCNEGPSASPFPVVSAMFPPTNGETIGHMSHTSLGDSPRAQWPNFLGTLHPMARNWRSPHVRASVSNLSPDRTQLMPESGS